jgi:transposase
MHLVPYEENMLKKDTSIMEIINSESRKHDLCRIKKLAKENGRTVLRLPPYHCELNPVELMWAELQHHVIMNILLLLPWRIRLSGLFLFIISSEIVNRVDSR